MEFCSVQLLQNPKYKVILPAEPVRYAVFKLQDAIMSRPSITFTISVVMWLILMPLSYADNNDENNREKLFADSIAIEYKEEHHRLFLTGLTVRKKYFLDIYSMAHYLEQRPEITEGDIYQAILYSQGTKQISMVFMRSLTAEQIQESLTEGLEVNTDEKEFAQILPYVEKFMNAIHNDVKKNDEFIIRWFPDGTMVSIFQGNEISTIRSEQFARTLWSIWFGKYSVVDRNTLVKQLLTSS